MRTWNFPRRKEARRRRAEERQSYYDSLTLPERLTRLAERGQEGSAEYQKVLKELNDKG